MLVIKLILIISFYRSALIIILEAYALTLTSFYQWNSATPDRPLSLGEKKNADKVNIVNKNFEFCTFL